MILLFKTLKEMITDGDIEKALVSKRIFSSEKIYKYFIDYSFDDHKVKPLHIMLPKTSPYAKLYHGQTKWIYILIEDDDLLEKYHTVWDKVSADIKKSFIANLSIMKNSLKPKLNLMVMKLQIFTIKKFLRWVLIILA